MSAGGGYANPIREVIKEAYHIFVYYRFSVDHGLEGWGQFEAEFGAMKGHVDDYLARDEPSSDLDRCVTASAIEGVVSLDRIRESAFWGISLLTPSR